MSINRNKSVNITVIETEIHAKMIIETELKYIANNGIEMKRNISNNGYNTAKVECPRLMMNNGAYIQL